MFDRNSSLVSDVPECLVARVLDARLFRTHIHATLHFECFISRVLDAQLFLASIHAPLRSTLHVLGKFIVHVRGRASFLPCTTMSRTKVDVPYSYVNLCMEGSSCFLQRDGNNVASRARCAEEQDMSLPDRVS